MMPEIQKLLLRCKLCFTGFTVEKFDWSIAKSDVDCRNRNLNGSRMSINRQITENFKIITPKYYLNNNIDMVDISHFSYSIKILSYKL
jgi:hypothetical protein